ncbi:MAG: EAL domain-containing protein [Burkholderiaceae bacterium]|nr:EAL domain-containing protein [Burkholderiaceae bacterium]
MIATLSFIACLLAQGIALGHNERLLIWPAGGIAFAFGWRYGRRWALAAAPGVFAWALLMLPSPWTAPIVALGTVIGPVVALTALSQLGMWKPPDYRLDAAVRMVVGAVFVAAPIDAILVSIGQTSVVPASLTAAIVLPTGWPLLLGWWLIDALGILLLTPLLLAWLEPTEHSEHSDFEATLVDHPSLLLTLAVVLASLVVSSFGAGLQSYALAFFYFPIVAWISIRNSYRSTATTLAITALTLLMLRSYQVDATGDQLFRALEASVLVFCAVVVALMLQAIAADRRVALLRVAHQARQDLSTGLLNDRGLLAEVGELLAVPDRPGYGLLGLHFANFDALNDLSGSIPTLQLEQDAATLLRRQPGVCAAARLSGGRFALLIHAETLAAVRSVAREVYSHLSGQVLHTNNGSIRLQVCIGALLIDRTASITSEDCLFSLSDAMAIAASVRDPQLFVEPLSQSAIDARRAHQSKIEHIRESIREHRFEMHAQTILDPEAPPGKVSYEMLIRLIERDGSLIHPPEFLSLAVQAQMTPSMDRGVIKRVFGWLASNPEALARTHKCSINLSGLTMSEGSIAGYIREQRALYAIPANQIVFEITESEAIRNPAAASRLVDELKADGFGIALDDFGTGLATFEYLKRFPLDYLKIDGSFIRSLPTDEIDEEIVLATVRVARRLNICTIAEHVHTREIFDRLTDLGVRSMQGELLGRPIRIDQFFAAIDGYTIAAADRTRSRSLIDQQSEETSRQR